MSSSRLKVLVLLVLRTAFILEMFQVCELELLTINAMEYKLTFQRCQDTTVCSYFWTALVLQTELT